MAAEYSIAQGANTPQSTLTHLACGLCGAQYDAEQLNNLSPCCARPLLARYDLERAAQTLTADA